MSNPLALIIEDDPRLSEIFSLALQGAEFETEIAADGQTALERLAEMTPAIIVLDMHLPGVSGKDILRHIHSNQHLARTRVILATADSVAADALREDADLVLLKPISPIQLRDLASRLRLTL